MVMPGVFGLGLLLLGVWALRRRARNQRDQAERSSVLAIAYTWGISALPGESTAELRKRVQAAAQSGLSGDPIETAARALRAQRERRERRSEPDAQTPRRS